MKIQTIFLCASLAAIPFARAADNDTNTAAAPAASDTNAPTELTGTNGLTLNFHEAPLGVVLDYLSQKAGYIIMSDSDLRDKITLESATPVTKDELRDLLNSVLSKNNYRAIFNGRTLTIKRIGDAANSSETPVANENDPDKIPINDTVGTYIIGVHSLDPVQLIKDLDQLVPAGAKISANEAGNAIIMTAPGRDVHHFAQIIKALDSSAVASVAVFPLKYGDAKSIATELKEVFQSPDSTVSRANRAGSQTRFRGFGGGGGGFGFPGMGGGGGDNASPEKNAATQAVFTSDDLVNAVIAAAPPELMPAITNIIEDLDQPTEDVTVVRLFHLQHADPTETAEELTTLFSTTGNSDQNNRGAGFQFFRGPFGFPGGGGGGNSQSDRMKRQNQVTAVADPRTDSVIVTASHTLMAQIDAMIVELDKIDAHQQVLTVIDISGADPTDLQTGMQSMFAGQNSRTPNNQTQDPRDARATTAANQQNPASATSFGTSGTGSGGGAGGR